MSVTITIKTASLLSDIRIRSHMNTQRIKDPEEQYALRIGEENESAARQALQEAWSDAVALCRPFLVTTDDTSGDDLYGDITSSDKTLTLDVTTRRTSHIADSIPEEIHAFLANAALKRFYTSAMMPDLVSIYAAAEKVARQEIIELLYKKMEPVYEEDPAPTPDPDPQNDAQDNDE